MSDAYDLYKELSKYQNSEDHFVRFCKEMLGSLEGNHFDFKEKQDRRNGNLGDNDKKNLAKAVSGFANSGGGVLIWGLGNQNLEKKPISEVQRFVASLLELASKTTEPFVQGIDGTWISDNGMTGYALIYIPESDLPPHRVALRGEIQHHYYVRTGSSFEIATHTMLEDMFGRRPKPQLEVLAEVLPTTGFATDIVVSILISITNKGRGVARGPYVALQLPEPYKRSRYGLDGNGGRGLQPLPSPINKIEYQYGSQQGTLIHSGMTLPVDSIEGQFPNTKEFTDDIEIKHKLAAEGLRLFEGVLTVSASEINRSVKEYRGK